MIPRSIFDTIKNKASLESIFTSKMTFPEACDAFTLSVKTWGRTHRVRFGFGLMSSIWSEKKAQIQRSGKAFALRKKHRAVVILCYLKTASLLCLSFIPPYLNQHSRSMRDLTLFHPKNKESTD